MKIFIVDDDFNVREILSLYLKKEGYEVLTYKSGDEALSAFTQEKPDLLILDIMMPGLDGYDVLAEVRKVSKLPIMMLTAKGEITDKISGFDLGADDYLVKPFDTKEVVARVKAIERRTADETSKEKKQYRYENLIIDMNDYTVTFRGQIIEMPPKEIELLCFLASKPNVVFNREQLLEQVWGFDFYGDTRTIDVHIKRIRKKLETDKENWAITTVWGVGYKFEVNGKDDFEQGL